jgi:hypothetical protein
VRRFASILFSALLFIYPASILASPTQAAPPPPFAAASSASIILSAGTKVELFVTRPVRAATAKAGDQFYAQTSFPVVAGNGIAIPAGTYVEGSIESVTRPTRRSRRAEINVLFTKIIFANGYIAPLPGDSTAANTAPGAAPRIASAPPPGDSETLIAIAIQATTANDLLLDNGAGVEMTLAAPLSLDAQEIAEAIPLSHTPQPGQFKSATQCRNIPGSPGDPGTPGTPDTVIPGNPGTPGVTIPGGPGMPDTVIPGIPATPNTVIPGNPGTPGMPGTPDYICPAAPMVISCAPVAGNKQPLTSQPVAAR